MAEDTPSDSPVTKQPLISQPLLACLVLQHSDHVSDPLLGEIQFFRLSLPLGGPKPDTVFWMLPPKCHTDGNNYFL